MKNNECLKFMTMLKIQHKSLNYRDIYELDCFKPHNAIAMMLGIAEQVLVAVWHLEEPLKSDQNIFDSIGKVAKTNSHTKIYPKTGQPSIFLEFH